MPTDIVFTLTGPDRVGIVEEVTKQLLELGGNVGTSRMARLGGEFVILMLASVPSEKVDDVEPAMSDLVAKGYQVTVRPTEPVAPSGTPYRVAVSGADHEGIVHEIAAGLAEAGINIESVDTATVEAPVTGAPLFTMTAIVAVPADVLETDWIDTVVRAGAASNVDVEVAPV